MGVKDLVIPWSPNATPLFENARRKGYRVYAEVAAEQAGDIAKKLFRVELTGIVVNSGSEGPNASGDERLMHEVRAASPKLTALFVDPGGKQAQMRGTTVINRNGFLVVSSPTRQPWIDSNVALIRFERAYHPSETPLLSYAWQLMGALARQVGPPPEDYALAVAEAGAFRADLVLNLHEKLQEQLASGNPEAWAHWKEIELYIDYYSQDRLTDLHPIANVGVVTDDYGTAYEAMNLMARHNIPFRVIPAHDFAAPPLNGLAVIVLFNRLEKREIRTVSSFASQGATTVLVGQQGSFPWRASGPIQKNENAATYRMGSGRVVELAAPIVDPESFAQDIRRLLRPQERLISLWNALTVLASAYQSEDGTRAVVELVNYAEQALQVQVRVKGTFTQVRYETPERGCCEVLTPDHDNGFTQFVVPWLRVGGTIHLGAGNTRP